MRVTTPSRRTFVATGLVSGAALGIPTNPSQSQSRSQQMQAVIRVDNTTTTLINVFSADADKQAALILALKEGTETFFSKQPGFISASVVAGKEGRQVINYSQWRGASDIEAFRRHASFTAYIQRIAALAKAETLMGDVVFVHAA